MSFKQRKNAIFCALTLLTGMLTGCGSAISVPDTDSGTASITSITASVTDTTGTDLTTAARTESAEQSTESARTSADTTAAADSSTTVTTAARSTGTTAGTTQSARQTSRSVTRSTTASTGASSAASTRNTQIAPPSGEHISQMPYVVLDSMTLEQKVAQMMLVGVVDEATANAAAKAGVGALCLFAKPFKGKTKSQVIAMTAKMQSNAKVQMILSADEEGAPINRVSLNTNLRSEPFPNGKSLYASGGWDAVIRSTKEKSELLLSLGVNVNLAPVADVPLDKSNYIADRCFSLDAEETAEYIRTVVTQMKQDKLGSTLKHFPGYGGSVDTHKSMGYDTRDYSAFTERDFLPFIAGIEAGADAVMVSHNIVKCMDSKNPASLSPAVHNILREDLGFTGVIISDDLGMNAITEFTSGKNPAVAAVLAGNDMVAYSDYKTSIQAIVKAVKDGTIPQSQIDASVLRILKWKRFLGLI